MKKGDRVELHPVTDRWMMGDRYGVVVEVKKVLRKGSARQCAERSYKYKVKFDKSGEEHWYYERNLRLVDDGC